MKTKLFTLLLAVAASVGTIFADKVQIGDLYYNLDAERKTAEVISNDGDKYSGDIMIPSSVTYNNATYSVTGIGSLAFYECKSLTAIIIPNSVTNIGDYAFYNCSGLISITIPNSVTSIGDAAFYQCTNLSSPVYNAHVFAYLPQLYFGAYTIPNGIESIAPMAFPGCTGLTNVTIPSSVTSIGAGAFVSCTGLTSVTCMATILPSLDENVFERVDKSILLYVPVGSINAYKVAEQWKEFTNILPITAKETETTTVKAEPTTNSVEITWPVVAGAYTYEIVIKDKSGNVVCTLVFNAQGQLISIAFNAPSRDGAPQHKQEAGFSFVVNGLDSGTEYSCDIIAKDENGSVLDTKSGSFTTQAPQGIDDINAATKSQKIVRDNQVLILRGEKTYTVTGQEIK